jgi:glycosyltransferase involved in cell wall biosynthesis
MADPDQLNKSLEKKVAEQEQIIQSLKRQVAGYDRLTQSLEREVEAVQTAARHSLAEKDAEFQIIASGRAWKLVSLLQRIRSLIALPGSVGIRSMREMADALHSPLKKSGRKPADSGGKPWKRGEAGLDPARDTVLLVSHEASRTGAPIISLNLVQNLQKKYNVVSLLLSEGPLEKDFLRASSAVAGPLPFLRENPALAADLVESLTRSFTFRFAIVNSIESRAALLPLAERSIPAITLIHEFAANTRPGGAFIDAALWSQEMIFSTPMTLQNAISDHPEMGERCCRVIPQGLCNLSFGEKDAGAWSREDIRVRRALRPEGAPEDMAVILGVGTVHVRKGVDLFISCAAEIVQSCPDRCLRFVWIGGGYEPEKDTAYSVYLAYQIQRLGLQDTVFFIGEITNMKTAYEMSDLLLISSRLDPLPNMAIEAMSHSLPLVCFEGTSGIADILTANGLGEACVAQYLDTRQMAVKAAAFIQSMPLRQRVGEQLQELADKEFNMDEYTAKLEEIALASCERTALEKKDADVLAGSPLPRLDFFYPGDLKSLSRDGAIRHYIRAWASGIRRRKPFPGFHPGVYAEQTGMNGSAGDPLADYLRAGQPEGPWRYDVLTDEGITGPVPTETRIALHLNVFYPDLLPDMLERLLNNDIRPDLFISVSAESCRNEAQSILKGYPGKVIDIQVMPSCGGDIGPLITGFGDAIAEGYDIVGHLHTKRSADRRDPETDQSWRVFLMENLLGGRSKMADRIAGLMTSDRSIGLVFPDDPNIVGWGKNRLYAETLARRLQLDNLPQHINFPMGTMFWARVEALLPFFGLGLDWQDYSPPPFPHEDSILLALERLLPLIASKQGFRSVLTNVKGITR